MSQLFTWGGQSTGVSALASFLPKNTQDWSPLEWTDWISLQSTGLSRVFSNTTVLGRDLYFSCCLIQFSQWPGRLVSFLQGKNLRLEATKYLSKVTQEGMEWELKALFLWSHSLHFVYQVSSLNPNFVIYKNESKNILCITADSYASTRKGQPTHGEDSVSLILSAGQSWIRAFGTKMAGTQKCCCLQLSTSYVHLVWSV